MSLFDLIPETEISIHTDLPMILRPVSSYPLLLINTFPAAGLLYIHLYPEAVSNCGWNLPFRTCTAAVRFFLFSNVFLVTVPWVSPAPGYKVSERTLRYVSEV